MTSFNTTVRQMIKMSQKKMTEMFQRKKNRHRHIYLPNWGWLSWSSWNLQESISYNLCTRL